MYFELVVWSLRFKHQISSQRPFHKTTEALNDSQVSGRKMIRFLMRCRGNILCLCWTFWTKIVLLTIQLLVESTMYPKADFLGRRIAQSLTRADRNHLGFNQALMNSSKSWWEDCHGRWDLVELVWILEQGLDQSLKSAVRVRWTDTICNRIICKIPYSPLR